MDHANAKPAPSGMPRYIPIATGLALAGLLLRSLRPALHLLVAVAG